MEREMERVSERAIGVVTLTRETFSLPVWHPGGNGLEQRELVLVRGRWCRDFCNQKQGRLQLHREDNFICQSLN